MESVIPISFPVRIRQCTYADLKELEWFGLFTAHRRIIRAAFRKQLREEQVMLVAEGNGHLIGQIWIDLKRYGRRKAGFLWAFRVVPWLQGMGIGAVLLRAAENELRSRGLQFAEVSVDIDNPSAREVYEHYGYAFAGLGDPSIVADSSGRKRRHPRWIFRKELLSEEVGRLEREISAA